MSHENYEDAVNEIESVFGKRLKSVRYEYDPRAKEPHQVIISIQSPKANGGLIRWARGPSAYVAAETALLDIRTADSE